MEEDSLRVQNTINSIFSPKESGLHKTKSKIRTKFNIRNKLIYFLTIPFLWNITIVFFSILFLAISFISYQKNNFIIYKTFMSAGSTSLKLWQDTLTIYSYPLRLIYAENISFLSMV